MDGSEENFDKITGVPGTFTRVTNAIDLLHSNGYDVQINSVLHKANLNDVPFLIKYSYEKNLPLRLTFLNTTYGRAKFNSQDLSIIQIQKIIKAIHVARKVNPLIELNLPPLLLHPDEMFSISPSCGWMHHQCGILSNGDVTICGLSSERPELVAGNVKSQSLQDIWLNSPLFESLRCLDAQKIKGICGICPFLTVCGGSCRLTPYLLTGDFCAPNNFCDMFYQAMKDGSIEENDFPSYVVSLGLMKSVI